jgi:hypothetical protein
VAAGAATTGPAFLASARAAVLADALHRTSAPGRQLELVWNGALSGLDDASSAAGRARSSSGAADLLAPRVRGQERSWLTTEGQSSLLVWRDGACGHLRIVSGRCPTAAGEAAVSRATATLDRWQAGDGLDADGIPLTIVGVYTPIDPDEPYWSGRGYFPQEGFQLVRKKEDADVAVTVPETFRALPPTATGITVIDYLLDVDAVTPDRVPAVRAALGNVAATVAAASGVLVSGIGGVLDNAEASVRTLQVPIVLITVQLLVPVWLLLFLAIGDAARAREPDVALSTLRGHSRGRTLGVALAEPIALLVAALPLGLLAGWAASGGLAEVALRPGMPVTLPGMAIVAAVAALSAGLLAAVLAGVRAVRRPVLEQWRLTPASGTRRGWLVDVAVGVATAAGIAELYAAGAVGSASTHVLALLVPGLAGLGTAVLTARLLPWAGRRLFRPTARHGGLAAFLAVREVARRPAGLRTVMLLGTAFALVTFAVAASTVTAGNIAAVAATQTGAATVLDVLPASGEDLAATIDRLDPGGGQAVAVESFSDFGQHGRRTLAVDPARFARVAFWRSDFAAEPLSRLAARLHPPAPDPVPLPGDRVRIQLLDVTGPVSVTVELGLQVPAGLAVTPLVLGTVTAGPQVLEAPLPSSSARLRSLTIIASAPQPQSGAPGPVAGSFTVAAVQTRTGAGWRPAPGLAAPVDGSASPGLWQPVPAAQAQGDVPQAAPGAGLRFGYRMSGSGVQEVTWAAVSWPAPMPALVSRDVAADRPAPGGPAVAGLDGAALPITPVATVVVPGAPSGGVIVDRTYARRAAFDTALTGTEQVWLAAATPASFADRLRSAGARVVAARTPAAVEAALRQQGPALATVLFVADATVAAGLATAGAVAALHLAGRRRRYELSALAAAGCPRRTLRMALWLEQLAVLGAGLAAGVTAGVAAVRMALPAVPEFVEPPADPPLRYDPAWEVLAASLVATALVVAGVALLSGVALMAQIRADRLREAAQ